MLLERFSVRNYCQHRQIDIDIKPGLTAILGPNGSGKSNLLNGIYATLTGDFTRNPGTKADNISQLSTVDEPSQLELTFSHAGARMEIVRSLRPLFNKLSIDNQVVRKVTEIDLQLEDILGISKKLISDFIFVPQKAVDGLLNHSPAERAAAFQRLFGTWKLEKCFQVVGDFITKTEVPTISLDKDYLTNRIELGKKKLDSITVTLKEYADIKDNWSETTDETYIQIQAAERAREYEKDLELVNTKIHIMTKEVNSYENKKVDLLKTVNNLRETKQQAKLDADNGFKAIDWWKSYTNYKITHDQITKNITNLQADLACQVIPIKPIEYQEVNNDVLFALSKLQDRKQTLERFIATYHEGCGIDKCKECLTPISVITASLDQYKAELSDLVPTISQLQQTIEISKTFDKTATKYNNSLLAINSRISSLEKIRSDTLKPEIDFTTTITNDLPGTTAAAAKQQIDSYDRLCHNEQKYESLLASLDQSIVANNRLLRILQDRQSDIADKVKDSKTDKDIYELKKIFRQKCERYKQKVDLQITYKNIESTIASDTQLIIDLQVKQHEYDKISKTVAIMTEVKNVLHRDSLPKLVSQKYLELLEEDVNLMLEKLSGSFRVILSDNLSFRALFPDGRNVPAERLSGGEKVVLSLALRVVVNATFASEIGLLCLDEPTDSLDEDNLKCLEVALDQLKQLSKTMGLQCLLITHIKRFAPLFDNVITLH